MKQFIGPLSTIAFIVATISLLSSRVDAIGKVIFAVNAGGPSHVDLFGIRYAEDRLAVGVASDFGRRYDIRRAHPQDHILYQTERYHDKSFSYDIPIKEDGTYVLVLKFCEVYFRSPQQKIFNVAINEQYLVVSELDIFREVGHATAHDEYVQFTVKNNAKIFEIDGQKSDIRGGKVRVKFIKGPADNPKVNALYVMKGTLNDVPRLPPMAREEPDAPLFDDEEDEEEISYGAEDIGHDSQFTLFQRFGRKNRIQSGIPYPDPWEYATPTAVYLPLYASLVSSALSLIVVRSLVK